MYICLYIYIYTYIYIYIYIYIYAHTRAHTHNQSVDPLCSHHCYLLSAPTVGKESRDQLHLPPGGDTPLRLRYQVGPCAEPLTHAKGALGYLQATVVGLRIPLVMSTITHLVEMVEDEVIPEPMPMHITMCDCTFTLEVQPRFDHIPYALPLCLFMYIATISV